MKKTQLTLAVLLATGLAAAPFAAEARSHKTKHHSSMSKSMSNQGTTGANMKSGTSANPSSQGNVGPGTNQAGSMSTPK
jgi:hypothetical protein